LWHSFDDLLTVAIPNYFIDGCTSCVMLTKGCQHGIGQPFIISKLLTKVFLDIIAEKREFQGPGNVILKTLIGQLTTRKLVALSPYIDEEGVKFLKNLKSRGVDITIELLNTQENSNFLEDLKRAGINVLLRDKVHRKAYIIDDSLVINTSTNLNLRSGSYNSFSLRRLTI
jgi:Fe-S oxidoreductase